MQERTLPVYVKGKSEGETYSPEKDAWALAYDGRYLWTIQGTSEAWDDSKIYKVEILDSSSEAGE